MPQLICCASGRERYSCSASPVRVQAIAEEMVGWTAKHITARAKNCVTNVKEREKRAAKREPDAHALFYDRLHDIIAEVRVPRFSFCF